MDETHIIKIAQELKITAGQVSATAALLAEGGTIPFIARYRKEATGSLDEVSIGDIRDRLNQLAELDKRREAILGSLLERELLTDELKERIETAQTMAVLEDVYLPYRPKRRTRATVAREKGLEPLAQILMAQDGSCVDVIGEAGKFIDEEKGITAADEALAGARDIIAEWVNEDQSARAGIRALFAKGTIISKAVKGREDEGAKYRDYFEWEEAVSKAPSHRVLAMMRGENEGFLSLRITPDEEESFALLNNLFVKGDTPASEQVATAVRDSYKRLLAPSMENETRVKIKQRADEEAIRVFADNLRELLLAPPLGQKNILALDPGFRTGCKVVCLDRQGKLVHNSTIYPHQGKARAAKAEQEIVSICERFQIEAIAIGNGTAGRETETFIRSLDFPNKILVVMVNESGASVYSASDAAREEFPDYDVTVRGSVSIGRRLADPLAELVKIEPKSIGVGQYQHDVDQGALKQSLDDVVVSCVSGVGVEVNTASKQLLTYVSGLGPQLAQNIVNYRNERGPFKNREQLKDVPRLGTKAFEQAAGFLRIRGGENPLDASAVHPESYHVVMRITRDLDCSCNDLMSDESLRKRIDLKRYVSDSVGLPTLEDMLCELAKPGRDPREKFEEFSFAEGVEKLEDVKVGMKLPGIITNVTAFGAFVDVGVHQDGLVHISHLADRFVKDSAEVVKVHQKVMVTVLDLDMKRKRISLSMKTDPQVKRPVREQKKIKPQKTSPRLKPKVKKSQPKENKPKEDNWFAEAMKRANKM